jgi:hypothetical protein
VRGQLRRKGPVIGCRANPPASPASLWDDEEYTAAAVSVLPDDALLYAHELAILVKVKPATVDQWCWRGLLAPDAWDGNVQSDDPEDFGPAVLRRARPVFVRARYCG